MKAAVRYSGVNVVAYFEDIEIETRDPGRDDATRLLSRKIRNGFRVAPLLPELTVLNHNSPSATTRELYRFEI